MRRVAEPPPREIRREYLARPIAFGALAATDQRHPHVPDEHTGTMCQLCFGWCNDARHWGRSHWHV